MLCFDPANAQSIFVNKPLFKFRLNPLYTVLPLLVLLTLYTEHSLAATKNDSNTEPCEISPETTNEWYDLSHAYLSKKFCEPAVAFDNFFGDDRSLEEDRPGTYARWRNDIVWNEGSQLTFHTELRAKLRLPKINKRLKLIISEEHDDNIDNPLTNEPGDTTTQQTAAEQNKQDDSSNSSIALEYDIKSQATYSTSFRVGIKTQFPLKPHTSFRYRYTHPFGDNYLFRFTETVFWRKWEGFGETSRFDIEKLVNPNTLARTSLKKTFSETSDGVDIDTSVGVFYKVSARAGLSIDLVTAASTRPNTVITNYGVISKYRRNFYRKWLFFEVIPEINWPRDENDHYEGVNTLTMRLDIQFWEN